MSRSRIVPSNTFTGPTCQIIIASNPPHPETLLESALSSRGMSTDVVSRMANNYHNITLIVNRPSSGRNPHHSVLVHSTTPKALPANHIVIRVDRFGFSSNNITYQTLGEEPHFRYFDFHPAPYTPDVHGVIPVWGFGTIVASNLSEIHINERVFGYFAMARYLLLPVDVSDINQFNFYIPRPHLPRDRRPYNQITRCSRDKLYRPAEEDFSMLYRPLFWTSMWAEDWLFTAPQKPYNGAKCILISSASAKTAFCFAYLVQKRGYSGVKVIGLTSKGNLTFTQNLGLYDTVFTYDCVEESVSTSQDMWIYIDVAGSDSLNSRVSKALRSRVVRNISLGITNLSPSVKSTYTMPGSGVTKSSNTATSATRNPVESFFMPEWLAERRRSLGASGISEMQYTAWTALMRDCTTWVKMERTWGVEEVRHGYAEVVKGRVGPEKGMVWSLWDELDGLRWERELSRRELVSGKL